jgi:hypothetical protein
VAINRTQRQRSEAAAVATQNCGLNSCIIIQLLLLLITQKMLYYYYYDGCYTGGLKYWSLQWQL